MMIEEHMRDYFSHVMKENGGGEYIQSPNKFSLSRQQFAGGHIFYDQPMNGFIKLTSDLDLKEVQEIWQSAIKQLADSMKEESNKEEKS